MDGECVKIYEMRERTREMERWRRRQNERDGEVKDQKNTFVYNLSPMITHTAFANCTRFP